MNRAELVDAVSKVTGQTKQQVQDCLSAVLHSVTSCVSKGEKVMLVGFGTFERRNRKARVGVNPQDPRKKLTIAAAKVPAFRPGQELKHIVNGQAKLPAVPTGALPHKSASKAKGKTAKKAMKSKAKKRR